MENTHEKVQTPQTEKALTSREYQMMVRREAWYQELNNLGAHWHPRESEHDARWRSQVDQAWMLAYIALRANGTKYFAHLDDEDSIINKAWELLRGDIESYDPRKSALGERISSKIKLRIYDAQDKSSRKRDHDAWEDELTMFQNCRPAGPDQLESWIDSIIRKAFRFYRRRIDAVAATPEIRANVRNALADMLARFDPSTQSLLKLMDLWVSDVLHGDQEDVSVVSLDKPIGDDEETTLSHQIPDDSTDPANLVQQRNAYSILLIALIANYQVHVGQGKLKAKTRYARLNYTEQLACFAQAVPLPDDHTQDLLNPLEDDYFRYFMHTAPGPLGLRAVENARLRTVIGSGPYLLENERWDKHGLLPAKAQMGYLDSIGIHSSDATISGHRKPYKQGFLSDLEKRR